MVARLVAFQIVKERVVHSAFVVVDLTSLNVVSEAHRVDALHPIKLLYCLSMPVFRMTYQAVYFTA